MTCYVTTEKTVGSRIKRSADCLEYIDYLLKLCKEVLLLKKEGCQHFVFCSDCEFTDDFHKAVVYFFNSDATVEFDCGSTDKTFKENDIIISVYDGGISRKNP